jgi:hypothetical protein
VPPQDLISVALGKNEITYESLYIRNDLYQETYIHHKGQKENGLFQRVS